MNYYVLFNPNAGNGTCEEEIKKLKDMMAGDTLIYCNMTEIGDYRLFFDEIPAGERIILCGGDGTINRFINEAGDFIGDHSIYYFASGSGNDFLREFGKEKGTEPFCIDEYIKNLPEVEVNGKTYKFLNGVGYGIDGYCCEVGDKLREESDKPVNYTSIAIKGLLFHYKPTNAVITVDGVKHEFEKVWLAPTMNGHYYGGGMIPTPDQDRLGKEHTVSTMVMHGSGKLKTLMIFPSIFKGEHVKHTDTVKIFKGHDITVEFDRPTAIQIDGETILGVTKYKVTGFRPEKAEGDVVLAGAAE